MLERTVGRMTVTFDIQVPERPETQTERIQLLVTPTLKKRLDRAKKVYNVSMNSLIAQLVTAGLDQLDEVADEHRKRTARVES